MTTKMKSFLTLFVCLFAALLANAQAPGGVSSGLSIWLKADAGTSSSVNGAFLSDWNDQSGNGVNANQPDGTNVARPRFATDIMNGNPGIEFNGGGKFFNINWSSLGSTYTIITVVKRTDATNLRYIVGVNSSSPRGMHIGYATNTTIRMSEGAATNNADAVVTGFAGTNEVPAIVMGEQATASSRTITEIKNGSTVSGTNTNTASGPGLVNGYIGRGFSTSGLAGYICEIICYNRSLTATEKASIYTYLSVKYGLTISIADHDYYDDATYTHDIFGIGRNSSTQGLNQSISSSENPDDMVRFSSPSSLENGDYLISGNDNGALTWASYGGSNCAISHTLNRKWRAQETGETGALTIRFDLTSLTVNPEDVILLLDNDNDGFDDENPIEGTYSAPFMTFTNVNLSNNAVYTLGQGVATWYSRGSGNMTDAIWAKTPTGTSQALSSFCSRVSLNIQAGHSVTNNATVVARNFTVASTATFTQGNTNITLHGTYLCNGTHTVGTGNVNFNGTVSQTIGGTSIPEFHNVNCNNSAGVSISGTGLRVKGVLQVNSGVFSTNGKLTLSSYSTTTGSIGPLTSGDVLGNVTIERYFNGTQGWVNICSPVQNRTVSDWNDDIVTTGFPGSDFPSYAFNNVQYYNEPTSGNRNQGFVGVSSTAETLNAGRGYFIYMNAGILQLDVDGPIYKNAQNLPVTYTNTGNAVADGWCLVANPYPSAINWDASGWTKTNMANAVYIWDDAIDQYASYVGGVGTNGGSGIIPSTQSFFVQATSSSPVLSTAETVKTSSQGTFKEFKTQGVLSIALSLAGKKDETVIVFEPGTISQFEANRDAYKIKSTNEQAPYFASVSTDGLDLSINNLEITSEEFIIPLKIESLNGGKAQLNWKGLSLASDEKLYFEDMLTGKVVDMTASASTTADIAANDPSSRFRLRYKKVNATNEAQQAASFVTGTLTNRGVQLTFHGESEHRYTITGYTLLGQLLIEPFTGVYSNQIVEFGDARYARQALIEVINMDTGERNTIKLVN